METLNNTTTLTEQEIWLDIPGYDGKYEVSNFGRVRSLNYRNTGKTQELKVRQNRNYLQVDLHEPKNIKTVVIHRLVALAFIKNDDPVNKPYVDHINGNQLDNSATNLRWVSVRDNSYNRIGNRNGKNSSKYIGVTLYKTSGKWKSQLMYDNICYYNGVFEKEVDAALAYDNKLISFGEKPVNFTL